MVVIVSKDIDRFVGSSYDPKHPTNLTNRIPFLNTQTTLSAATAARATASERSVSQPSVTGRHPAAAAASRSSGAQPPSGPTIRAAESGVSRACSARSDVSFPPAAEGSTNSRLIEGFGDDSHASSERTSVISGNVARRHCFADAIATRRQRSVSFDDDTRLTTVRA